MPSGFVYTEGAGGLTGTVINAALIVAGSLLGLLLRKGIPERMRQTVLQALGLSTVVIGLSGAFGISGTSLKSVDTLCLIVCMAVGALIGSALNIEKQLNRLGSWFERRLTKNGETGGFAKGFVSATLVYCVGAMAIVGSINSGIHGDHATLIAKGIIDGISAIFFASAMGIGMLGSAAAVFVYQGTITLLASAAAPVLTDAVITQMGAVGGLLVAAIGLNLVREKQIPVANMLPAIFLPLIYLPLAGLLGG